MAAINISDQKKEDSLKKRYFYKLSGNLIGVPIGIISQSLIARGLGPANYGNFSFLEEFFRKAVGFFDTGTSQAFYTKLSQRLREFSIIKFYWLFIALVTILNLIALSIIVLLNKHQYLLPDQRLKFIWMGLFFGLFTWYSQIINKVVDAYGLTVKGEIVNISKKVIGLGLIIILFSFNRLNLTNFFIYHYIILFILVSGWWYILNKNNIPLFPKVKLDKKQRRGYIKEFYIYSHPLIIYAFIGLIVGIFDRWILQFFGGSVQQGFYGLSYKIAGIYFIFVQSLTPLITREFSIANSSQNINEMRNLFLKYIPSLFAIITYFSAFLAAQAEKVANIVGGEDFRKAGIAIAIMSFYPIHQTYGQLSGSVYYATGRTKLYRNIGVFTQSLGLITVFFLIAPKNFFGLNLGALGLAIKMVAIQLIGVNIQLWYNCKYLKLSFFKFLSHQVYTIFTFLTISFLSMLIVDFISEQNLVSFIISGILYTIISMILVMSFPSIISMTRKEIADFINKTKKNIFKRE